MQFGRLICLEGIEGTGKTTQVDFIADYIKTSLKKPVITTREPGGTPFAEAIRKLFLNAKESQESIAAETELFLIFAARKQHIMQVIKPAIQAGYWVVCDRFTEATYAYQGGGRGVSSTLIKTLEIEVHQNLNIDRVLLLDMPVSIALDRLQVRYETQVSLDRIEIESFKFFEKVRAAYLSRAQAFPSRYRIIDAVVSLKEIQSQIMGALNDLLI